MSKIFDSRDTEYKSPFGAAVCGATVRFAVRPGDENVTGVTLLLRREFAGTEQEMALSPGDDGRWQGVYTAPEEPELLWYAFRFSYPEEQRLYGLHGFDDQARWQLTVYDDRRPTPAWFGRGITYQIFPDRFCRTRVPDPAGMVGNRVVHQDWDDTPVWRPDAQGIIRNNDFFGGSLAGITYRLDYLQSMGVGTLYLCPIFESDSNHRYDTADYRRIDPMLGTEEDFRTLCREAGCRGIRVMLDGVFNHTGSNSRYFNAQGFYPELGAAQSRESQYYNWYSFHPWPEDYDAWWGIKTLPAVQENDSGYRDFIIRDEVALVIAFEHGRAGLCKFCNQAVHDRDMILALGISAVDDMDEQIGVFQLLKRGAECLDQMVRQLGDEADRVRQQRLTGIGDSQLPCRGVKRVEQSVVCRDVRARECVQKR